MASNLKNKNKSPKKREKEEKTQLTGTVLTTFESGTPVPPENTPPPDIDFKAVVEESKAVVEGTDLKTPPKRRPGRPPKSDGKSPETPNSAVSNGVPVQPPPDLTKMIVRPIMEISKIPARKHGIPELAFDADEAMSCAAALNDVLNAFIPDINAMSPKTTAVVMCFVTFGSVGFTKYSIYMDKKGKEVFKKNVLEPVEEKPKAVPVPDVNPQDYFKR